MGVDTGGKFDDNLTTPLTVTLFVIPVLVSDESTHINTRNDEVMIVLYYQETTVLCPAFHSFTGSLAGHASIP